MSAELDAFEAPGGKGSIVPDQDAQLALRGLGCVQMVFGLAGLTFCLFALGIFALLWVAGELENDPDTLLGGIAFLGSPSVACGATSMALLAAAGLILLVPMPFTNASWLRALQAQTAVWVTLCVSSVVAVGVLVAAVALSSP